MQTYRAIIITIASVLNELYNTAVLAHCIWTARSTLPGIGHTVAWGLRVMYSLPRLFHRKYTVDVHGRSAIITAVLGGYYLRTFWSPWSIQVVLCQQLNLLFSMIITRGLGALSAQRQYAKVRRSATDEQPQSHIRGSLDFQWAQQQRIEMPHDPEYASTNSRRCDSESATSTKTLFRSAEPMDAEQPMTDQMVHNLLEQMSADALCRAESGSAPWSQTERDVTSESNFACTDEPETSLARGWSVHARSKHSVTKDDMIDSLTDVRVIGVERRVDFNGVKWRYLTKPDDITCGKHLTEGMEDKYGHVRHVFNLHNDYQYVSFEPKWVRRQELPRCMRTELWAVIGRKFWHHTDLTDSARWDGRDERYRNLSTGFAVHLCARRKCEACSSFAEQD